MLFGDWQYGPEMSMYVSRPEVATGQMLGFHLVRSTVTWQSQLHLQLRESQEVFDMPDWTASMQQTFEYYIVDPKSWRDIKRLENVKSCTISRDSDADTLGSATFEL